LALLLSPLERGGSLEERQRAAAVLGASSLDRAQMLRVIALVPTLGPLELAPVAATLSRGPADAELGERMLAAWREAPARFGVPGSVVQGVFRRFPEPVVIAAAPLVSEVMNAAAAKDSRVIELEKLAETGDATRGRAAFLAGTGACIVCHRVGARKAGAWDRSSRGLAESARAATWWNRSPFPTPRWRGVTRHFGLSVRVPSRCWG
jgi:hypothetical protein